MQNALIFLVKTLADLYLLTFLLRFIMQWVRASYYNPLVAIRVQGHEPARRAGAARVAERRRSRHADARGADRARDRRHLRLAASRRPVAAGARAASSTRCCGSLRSRCGFTPGRCFIYVLLSWFGDRGGNPMAELLGELVEPLLRPARRLLPPIGGLDLSPLIVILLLQAAMIALPLPVLPSLDSARARA